MTTNGSERTIDLQLPIAPAAVKASVLNEVDRLAPFVQGITVSQWAQLSAVPEWTIGDVVAHLNMIVGLYNRILDAAFHGWGSGPGWKAFGRITEKLVPAASPAFNAVNSALPRAVRGTLAPEVVQGQFAAGARKLAARVERVESADATRPIQYMGRPWPLSFFLAAVLNELAVHGWDMASRLDPAAHLSLDACAVLPSFYWSATSFMLRPSSPLQGTILADLSDPETHLWWRTGTEGTRTGRGDIEANSTITGPAGRFVLTLAGRISPQEATTLGGLSIDGDGDLARRFLGGWKIV